MKKASLLVLRVGFWILLAAAGPGVLGSRVQAAKVTLTACQDNVLYEHEEGLLSNGAGQHLFTGRTLQVTGALRRSLVRFDVAGSLPAGASILAARLDMRVSMTISGEQTQRLHRVTAAWGEGSSRADDQEGMGGLAESEDSTWTYSHFPTSRWTTPGGDFVASPSASADVAEGGISFDSDSMRADVQRWLDAPETNHGWILIGNEFTPGTAKRFDSRENPSSERRPRLTITFDSPCADGTVNAGRGAISDVLLINGSNGGSSRTVTVDPGVPVEFSLGVAPGGPSPGRYLLWVWLEAPTRPLDLVAAGDLLGCTVNPTPIDALMAPQPFLCLRGSGIPPRTCRGVPERAAPLVAPWALTGGGLISGSIFTLQGVLEDHGSGSRTGFSVTNALVLEVR